MKVVNWKRTVAKQMRSNDECIDSIVAVELDVDVVMPRLAAANRCQPQGIYLRTMCLQYLLVNRSDYFPRVSKTALMPSLPCLTSRSTYYKSASNLSPYLCACLCLCRMRYDNEVEGLRYISRRLYRNSSLMIGIDSVFFSKRYFNMNKKQKSQEI